MNTNDYNKKYNRAHRQAIADTRFVVLENRYDPTPNCKEGYWSLSVVFDTTPEADNSDGDFIGHRLISGSSMDFDDVTYLMYALFTDIPMHQFATLDEATRRYITHNIAPIEWHAGLDAGDPDLMARFQIFSYDDNPGLPADIEARFDAYWASR